MKKAITLSILLIFIMSTVAEAQRWRTRRYEAFIGAGTANIYADIGGPSSVEELSLLRSYRILDTRPAITGGFKYKLNHRIYLRTTFTGAYFTGDDAGTANEEARNGGYKFQSYVFEPTGQVEVYILPEDRSMGSMALYNRKGMINGFSSVYVYFFGGVGGILGYPTVTNLATGEIIEGDQWAPVDGFDFQRFGLVFPVGIGVKYSLSSYWTASLEFGRRITLTDYVDGYNSRFSTSNDMYDFVTFTASYKIRTSRNGLPILFRRTGLR